MMRWCACSEGSVLKQEMRSLLCHVPISILQSIAPDGKALVDDSGVILNVHSVFVVGAW